MLTIEQLKQYYPATSGNELPLKRILIEYLQYELLSSIFAQPAAKEISFMDDTAVRICYNNNRFSEDMDYSQLTKDVEPLLINPELKARVTNFLPFIEGKLQDW